MSKAQDAKAILRPFRKAIWQQWQIPFNGMTAREWFQFEEMNILYGAENPPVEFRQMAFWNAYHITANLLQKTVNFGDNEVPERFQQHVDVPEPEEPPDLENMMQSVDVLSDILFAYNADAQTLPEECTTGGWFWLQIKLNSQKLWTESVIKLLPQLTASGNEQKSRSANYEPLFRLLETTAKEYCGKEGERRVRAVLQRRSQELRE